jgi:putative membrane protein
MNPFLMDLAGAAPHDCKQTRDAMIANYTDHAANERTFLAWIRTGLAVTAFGFFLVKLNLLVAVAGGGSPPRLPVEGGEPLVAAAARYAGLALVVTGIAIAARSGAEFERTRRAIDRDEVIHIQRTRAESLLSAAVTVAVVIFCIYLAKL